MISDETRKEWLSMILALKKAIEIKCIRFLPSERGFINQMHGKLICQEDLTFNQSRFLRQLYGRLG